jgi:DNA-binding transcriptional LysR family regulator
MEGRGEAGHINIGLVSSLSAGFLRELLTAWRAKFPDVELRFHKLSGNDAAARIVSRQIDVAFVAGEPKFYDGNTQPLWTSPLLAAIPQDHPAAENESIELKALASEEFLVTDMAPGPDIETFLITRLGDFGSKLRISRHAVGRETLLCMVGLGLGLTIVADTETGIAYPGVRFVPLEGEVMPFGALWLPGNDNPALRRFLSLARLMAKGWQAAQ